MNNTQMVRGLLELLLGGQVAGPLVALHQAAAHPGPEVPRQVLLAAVHVAAVDEGGDGVDLLAPRLAARGPRPREVDAGHAGILPHGERRVRLGHVDVEALGPAGVEAAPLLGEAGGADVVVEELAELHHHAAHALVGVVALGEGAGHHAHVRQIVARRRASGSEVMSVAWRRQSTEGDVCRAPVRVLDVVAPTINPLIRRGEVARCGLK